eukprot:196863-Prymnesium_polylepis.2
MRRCGRGGHDNHRTVGQVSRAVGSVRAFYVYSILRRGVPPRTAVPAHDELPCPAKRALTAPTNV